MPSIRPAPRMDEASRFGTNPVRSIASRTFARVAGATRSGLLRTRDTVIGAKPTWRAISRTPTRPMRFPSAMPLRSCRACRLPERSRWFR